MATNKGQLPVVPQRLLQVPELMAQTEEDTWVWWETLLANAFFSIPLDPKDEKSSCLHWLGLQYTFPVMPQD